MGETFVAARYMTRFQCTGAACEDICCHVGNWSIPVSESDYRRLELAMIGEGDRARDGGARADRAHGLGAGRGEPVRRAVRAGAPGVGRAGYLGHRVAPFLSAFLKL